MQGVQSLLRAPLRPNQMPRMLEVRIREVVTKLRVSVVVMPCAAALQEPVGTPAPERAAVNPARPVVTPAQRYLQPLAVLIMSRRGTGRVSRSRARIGVVPSESIGSPRSARDQGLGRHAMVLRPPERLHTEVCHPWFWSPTLPLAIRISESARVRYRKPARACGCGRKK
jgi:hypothetical protein